MKFQFWLDRIVELSRLLFYGLPLYCFIFGVSQVAGSDAKDCNVALQEFARHTSQFTLCAIIHARPIKLCELCINNYTNVQNAYSTVMKSEDEQGELCQKRLINVDRLDILENGYEYVQTLWASGQCESCFLVVNGSITDELKNETKEFVKHFEQVNTCLSKHYANGSYNQSVCKDCHALYDEMNEFYEKLKEKQGDGNICIDIVDSVNITRAAWSEKLGCGRKEMTIEVQLVAVLIAVSLLPVLFYVSTKQLTSRVETRISQQKRLVQTFSINSAQPNN